MRNLVVTPSAILLFQPIQQDPSYGVLLAWASLQSIARLRKNAASPQFLSIIFKPVEERQVWNVLRFQIFGKFSVRQGWAWPVWRKQKVRTSHCLEIITRTRHSQPPTHLGLLEVRVAPHCSCLGRAEREKEIIDEKHKNCPEGLHVHTTERLGLSFSF